MLQSEAFSLIEKMGIKKKSATIDLVQTYKGGNQNVRVRFLYETCNIQLYNMYSIKG